MSEIIIFNDCNGPLGFGRYAGPYRLATDLRDNGFTVQVVEFYGDMEVEEVEQVIESCVTDETLWVGFATTLYGKHLSFKEQLKVWLTPPMGALSQLGEIWHTLWPHTEEQTQGFFKKIKETNPKTKIVVGGYKALLESTENVDYWILGQGDASSVALSKHLKFGDKLKVIEMENSNVITDKMYDFAGFNDSKIVWHESDHIFPNEELPIETARGCIFKCAFCAFNLNGKKFGDYTKNGDTLRDELMYNYEHFGTTGYMVSDDTMNDSLTKIKYLHEVITSLPFKINISGFLRLDVIAAQREMIPLLHEMGLVTANFGIETFNQEAGKAIGKGADPQMLKEFLYELKDAWKDDVYTGANFIIGLPKESKESVLDTMEWLHRPDVPLHVIAYNRLYIKQFNRGINPLHISDYDMFKYGFKKSVDGWQYNATSKIEDDSQKYDIQHNENDMNWFEWTSPYMTAQEADQLVEQFYYDPRNAHKKFTLAGFVQYNRTKNLGYNKEETYRAQTNDPKFIVDAINQRRDMKEQYLQKLLINKCRRQT
jgi:hypothetical protein